ncbi:putative ABC transporter permease protein YvrB [Clostridia bacterium]|nr:putative ABC transporter permease protein YvrB [Clostridia bacterium]
MARTSWLRRPDHGAAALSLAARYALFIAATFAALLVCACLGSVRISPAEALSILWKAALRLPIPDTAAKPIILTVRLPRVLCVALTGASLSLCGAAMQGLLRNPLADGSTMGVSAGASLGAVIAIAFGASIPGLRIAGSMGMAMVFAFVSLTLILSLAYRLDHTLSTNTILLIGVIFSMFANSIISLITAFAGERIKSILFWTMGSLSGSNYTNVKALLTALIICGAVILRCARELNAFAIGEDNARGVGVNVKRVKLTLLISVSALIGVCVSIGGTIGFVGLVIPHIMRMITGPNHSRLLPASLFGGAVFLMLTDLLSRILLRPLELPIGVLTSLIGSVVFVYIFYKTRRK